jgi:3-oxoacyl-[acyl-carrier protein] reductase
MISLVGKIAMVTGASRGIGQAIATLLTKQGAYVIGTSTTAQGCACIENTVIHDKTAGEAVMLDVTNQQQIDNLLLRLADENKLPHILVNNAGITHDNLLLRMEDDEWDKVINTNLSSIYRLSKACIRPMLKARWGRIINIGSVVGASGNTGQTNYAAAKAGLIGFSKSLAQEIGSRNITVNVVAPGFIETDMTNALPDMVKDELLKRIALRHLGKVEDIAGVVAFLASSSADYITGQTIHVNGGMYMN